MTTFTTTAARIFALAGGLYLFTILYRFSVFVWIYFVRSSSVRKYLAGDKPYALITGSTDGIGASLAYQLHSLGFNLILHGRNAQKMRDVISDISTRSPGRGDIKYFIADAKKQHDFKELVRPFEKLNITILVNNVGGTPTVQTKLDEWEMDDVYDVVRWNALFPLGLTQALLSQLRRSKNPVLVMSVGSYAGECPPPRLSLYAASKRFVEYLSFGLQMDEKYWTPSKIEFMYLIVGEVTSNAVQKETTLIRPNADTFAMAVVDRIGCGRRRISPYVWHAVSQWFVEALGEDVARATIAMAMKQMYYSDQKDD